MKRIIIICEGQTEQEFCKTILSPFFAPLGIYLSAPIIKSSQGGIVPWPRLKRQIEIHLKAEQDAYVTTLIDYYGIRDDHNFPYWEESKCEPQVQERVAKVEKGMLEAVGQLFSSRFLPYIQLHEFEGLLFSNGDVFERVIPEEDLVNKEDLVQTLAEFDNPEMINTSRETSPSHRLERIINGYDKIVYGNYLAEGIGLNRIRERCPRFNEWIERMMKIGT